MENLAQLEARLESIKALRGLFSAMQGIAASRVQTAQASLSGIRVYAQNIEAAISDAAALLPRDYRPAPATSAKTVSALIVVCSEHGFAGAFNRLLLERAKTLTRHGDVVGIVGCRGASLAAEHGLSPAWTLSMATHVDGILSTARRTAEKIRDAESLRIIFGRYRGAGSFDVEVSQVLPPDPALIAPRQNKAGPLHQLHPDVLMKHLIVELLFAQLMRAMTESYASENAARLQVVQSASRNIEKKLEDLTRESRRLRQQAITAEMLEVISGGEAVTSA